MIEVNRPNTFVVGGAKCGTSSISMLLSYGSGIRMSRQRECHFFSHQELSQRVRGPGDTRILSSVIRDKKEYLRQFEGVPKDVIVDVSPSYLQIAEVPARIKDFSADAKIIILLRNPVDKVYSQYLHLWTEGRECEPFEEVFWRSAERVERGYSGLFDYTSGGMYACHLRRYLGLFSTYKVHIILFDSLCSDGATEVQRLEHFLGITIGTRSIPHANESGRFRSPILEFIRTSGFCQKIRRAALPEQARHSLSTLARKCLRRDRPVLHPSMREIVRKHYLEEIGRVEDTLGIKTGW